jgi:hypothetical protein
MQALTRSAKNGMARVMVVLSWMGTALLSSWRRDGSETRQNTAQYRRG